MSRQELFHENQKHAELPWCMFVADVDTGKAGHNCSSTIFMYVQAAAGVTTSTGLSTVADYVMSALVIELV